MDESVVPLAQIRRKRKLAARQVQHSEPVVKDALLDDEISRLEAELQGDDTSDADDDDDSDDDTDDDDPDRDSGNHSEAIPSLPAYLLPARASQRQLKRRKSAAQGGKMCLPTHHTEPLHLQV